MPVELPLHAAEDGGSQRLGDSADGALVRRTVLPSGVRVLTEAMPSLRSATVGMWVDVGSRDEADGHHGSTHFLEHLLFKGTPRRSAMDIATAFDRVGGEANAATGKEQTCYFARVMADDTPLAVDVLSDMLTSSAIAAEQFESERGVILEELAMTQDDPSEVVHERFAEVVLGGHALGRPIGGTPASIGAVHRDDVLAHYRQHYDPTTLVVAAAGGIEHEAVVEAVVSQLSPPGWLERTAPPRPRRVVPGRPPSSLPATGADVVVERDSEQAHVVLGTTGLAATDERRYTLSVLNAVLGGGMSSRLFQEVRERRGLAYTVYSFAGGYADGGYFGLYAGCSPQKTDLVVDLLVSEWERLAADGIDEEELTRAIGQLAGGFVLGLEDSGSRMTRLGRAELIHAEYVSVDEAVERLRAVTGDQVRELAAELAARPRSLAVVGPFPTDRRFGAGAAAAGGNGE